MNNYKSILLVSVSFLISAGVQAGIVSSAAYTEQTGVIDVDFDTLTLQGHALDDWMIFGDAGVYTERADSTLILPPQLSGFFSELPPTNYNLSWTGGAPVASGADAEGLGIKGWGTFTFSVSVPVDYSGIFRFYVGAEVEDSYTVSTVYSGDNQQVIVDAGSHGYIDVAYENNNAFAETLLIQTTASSAGEESSFYGAAVAQIPEPAVASLILLFGGSLLVIRRRFMRSKTEHHGISRG
ncbi:hypothetical protein P4E94_16510 [Pontiellaceae bacterium B12219]|nr:hypothetical protein [Pontiellaceae bacterium B12219]